MARATLSRWAPVVLWAGVLFALSAIPHLSTGLGTWDLALRKAGHLTEYAILGALLVRALRSVPIALLAGSAYAATDEVHQLFVSGRQGSTLDWLIDTIGVAAGILVFARLAASRAS